MTLGAITLQTLIILRGGFRTFAVRMYFVAWMYVEYRFMHHYLPRIPKAELLRPMISIHSSIFLLGSIHYYIAFKLFGGETTVILSSIIFSLARLILFYKYRKYVYRNQFEKKNWSEHGVTQEDLAKAIWYSWLYSGLIFNVLECLFY
jgi:hypothetical protein